MNERDKQLLLKDLSARLPHKQKVCYKVHDNSEEITETLSGCLLDYFKTGKIAVVKPYLRPMSDLTFQEFKKIHLDGDVLYDADDKVVISASWKTVDYMNERMIDYRNLIEKGLALEAPEGMYNSFQS